MILRNLYQYSFQLENVYSNSPNAGSSSNDKSLLISIDTDDDNDDDSETSSDTGVDGQSSDSKKDHNDDDGKGKNLEIGMDSIFFYCMINLNIYWNNLMIIIRLMLVSDMSNIQGEPTMWIRTTDQDFIEKLTEKKDTAFDIVYFYNMVTQPVIEREKETTFYCNGTVVITIKETTYPNEGGNIEYNFYSVFLIINIIFFMPCSIDSRGLLAGVFYSVLSNN